jgi:hypothetical protein
MGERLNALQRELGAARELLARKADNVDLADLDGLHRATADAVSELKVDLENVLKNLEAWMFDEPLAEPMADPALATSATVDAAAASAAKVSNRSVHSPPPDATPAARARAARARESDATPRGRAGQEAQAPAGSLARSGSGERRPPSSGYTQPAAANGPPSAARSPARPHQPLAASPTPSPRAHLLAVAGSAPSAPTSMRDGASPLSLANGSNQAPSASRSPGAAARTQVDLRKKALEVKRAELVATRLGGGAGDATASSLPAIRDLHASK